MREASHTHDLLHGGRFARIAAQRIALARILGEFEAGRRLPAWWRRFAGYERWRHDGTCGGWIDDHWMIAHWPSSRPIVLAPMIKFSADILSLAEMAEKLGDDLNRLMMLPAVVLSKGAEFEFCEIPLRESTRTELHYEDKK